MKVRTLEGIGAILLFLFVSSSAFAGVMEVVKSIASSGQIWVGIGTVILLYLLKRTPNESIQKGVGWLATFLGRLITLNLSKFKFSAPFWESYVEPWFIDIINNTLTTFAKKLEEALRSDNTLAKRNGNGNK